MSEEEPVSLMLYGDSQEMIEGPKILHGEFSLEGRLSAAELLCWMQ
jgi:hypothetical protein